MTARSCPSCWYATPGACLLHGRRKGSCAGWEEDRADMDRPTSADVAAARAVLRATERAG